MIEEESKVKIIFPSSKDDEFISKFFGFTKSTVYFQRASFELVTFYYGSVSTLISFIFID
jgi:hypothetical protein